MDNEEHKKKLLETTNLLMEAISKQPIRPKNKILLYSTYFMSEVSWDLTIADVDIMWVKQNRTDNNYSTFLFFFFYLIFLLNQHL